MMDRGKESDSLGEADFSNEEPGAGKGARKAAPFHLRLIPFLIHNRHGVVWLVILTVLVLEILQNLLISRLSENIRLLFDGLTYLILVPGGVWLLLHQLNKLETQRKKDQSEQDLQAEFSWKLGNSRTWDELVSQIVEFPHRLSAQAYITLFVANPASLQLQAEATCTRAGQVIMKPAVPFNPELAPVDHLPGGLEAAPIAPPHRYDISITRNGQQIGVLKLEYPHGAAPSLAAIHTLKNAAPVMALALEGALLQNMAAQQAAASETLRQDIAQNLHDSLAQNISYLRLKLDQLTGENSIREIGAVLQELERMRGIADEAYQQVRDTLDELNPCPTDNLVTTLSKQAAAIGERCGFSLRTSYAGEPRFLSPGIRQQILYIVREALYNIEKHAHAHHVHLQVVWLERELIVKITDDGVGFNPLAVPAEGHYGLWIMQQRAQEMGGRLKIGHGADDQGQPSGTEVTLWTPYPTSRAAVDKTGLEKASIKISEANFGEKTIDNHPVAENSG